MNQRFCVQLLEVIEETQLLFGSLRPERNRVLLDEHRREFLPDDLFLLFGTTGSEKNHVEVRRVHLAIYFHGLMRKAINKVFR